MVGDRGRDTGHPNALAQTRTGLVTTVILYLLSNPIIFWVLAPMVNQTERPKATPFKVSVVTSCGLLPYVGGLLVTLTRRIGWLALAGVAICVISTSGVYALRKSTDPVGAKKRLKVNPLLYGYEFAFTAIFVYCVLIHTTTTPIILCVLSAISWFGMSLWLRSYQVRSTASRSHLSLEESQQRIRKGSWIAFGVACFSVIGAILIAWSQHSAGR